MIAVAGVRQRAVSLPVIVLVLGTAALATRRVDHWALVVTVCVGLSAMLVPVAQHPRPSLRRWTAALALGAVAFAAVRWGWTVPAVPLSGVAVLTAVVAAVAQEVFFRRAMFGRLERWGPAVAIGITSMAFGLVHVSAYGWGVLPIDIAAGVLFGWQRLVTGGWTAPAATHVFANLIQMG